MRIRYNPEARPELAAWEYYIDEPEKLRGHWAEQFARRQPMVLELGCGKGGFLAQMAPAHPEKNYIALDVKSEMLVLAKRNGMPYDCTRIMEIADRYAIPVVEDAAEGFGSRFKGQVLGTFGKFGVLSFNGNKMITTSGGGALICKDAESKNQIMWYATQAREAYPYYQHEAIGYNYRMSNICAGIGRGQMTVADKHIAHHRHVQALYKELLKDVEGVLLHEAPSADYDSNFWLCTITLGSSKPSSVTPAGVLLLIIISPFFAFCPFTMGNVQPEIL